MNNQSKKTEKLKPQDSGQKNIKKDNDEKAVVKLSDKKYKKEEADFKEPAKKREASEQPVHPIKKSPKK